MVVNVNNEISSVNGNSNFDANYLVGEARNVHFILPLDDGMARAYRNPINAKLYYEGSTTVIPDGEYFGAKMVLSDLSTSIQWIGENSEWYEVAFQMKSHFVNQTLPLPLMKSGLEIILNWQLAKFAFSAISDDNGTTGFTYTIETPRLQCMLAIPHPDIIQMYAEQWKSPDGIIFHIPQYYIRPYVSTSSGAENETFTIQPGVRAANKVFIATTNQSDVNSQATQKDIYNYGNIQSLQLRVGTEEFPNKALYFGPSISDPPFRWRDVFMQTLMAAGVPMNARVRINPNSWAPTVSTDGEETVFCISLTRLKPGEGDDELAGVDLQVVPLEIMIQRYAAFGNALSNDGGGGAGHQYSYHGAAPMYFIVIEHDTYFKYQENETGLIR
jgi:hypothetical protein